MYIYLNWLDLHLTCFSSLPSFARGTRKANGIQKAKGLPHLQEWKITPLYFKHASLKSADHFELKKSTERRAADIPEQVQKIY